MTNKLKKKFLDYLQSKSAFYIYIKTYRDRHLSINPKEFTGQSKTTGDILLMINGHRGISINVTETTKTRTSKNVVVGSKDFCSKLSKLLGIKTDYTLLDCRIFSQSANIIVFSINTKL